MGAISHFDGVSFFQQLPTGLHREYFSTDDDSQTTDRAQVLVKAACDLFSMQARVNGEPLGALHWLSMAACATALLLALGPKNR